ncbi:MAG: T9SS type A sorting domain-containing protein [Bacteroidetes bacterium]|nr:T9SS type A sorting domain-containing protein [Bacteroidota bacterium]
MAQLQADVAALRLLYDSGTLTGISDAPTAVNEVTLSPNPASEYFTVKSDDKNTFDLELFNMNGQLVHAKEIVDQKKPYHSAIMIKECMIRISG